jgi:alkylhydroperoxidase family enzyme
MRALTDSVIRKQEAALGVPLDYLRSVADASPAAFVKFGLAMPLAQHRRAVGAAPWHLARLAATRVQDCGTCVQIVVNQARADGVPPATLRAALDGEADALADDERLALRYGEAVAARSDEVAALVEEVHQRLGEAALVDLALAVATAQLFPILKRGLGQDVACALVAVEV